MRIAGLIKRIFLERLRDKRTLALLFIAPLLILTLMNFVFDSKSADPVIGASHIEPSIVDTLEQNDIIVRDYQARSLTQQQMEQDNLDAFLVKSGDKISLKLLNADPALSKQIKMTITQVYQKKASNTVMEDMKAKLKDLTESLNKIPFSPTKNIKFDSPKKTAIATSYVYGSSKTTLFDTFSPILIGFFVFFFVFLISGIGFLKERTSGTLERMLMTPIRRYEIVIAYTIGFGLLAVLQTIVIVLYAIYVLHIAKPDSLIQVIIINLFIALVALSLGLLLSAFAKSEFQLIQFIPLVIVPQVFLSGLFNLETMPTWLQVLARFSPLYYAGHALKNTMYKQTEFSTVILDLIVLVFFAAVFILFNIRALKKYRTL